jgi:hypothetical protein
VGFFKKAKKQKQTEGKLGEEEVAVISSAIASVLQSGTTAGAIKRMPPSPWKLMGIKDLMVHGKQGRGARGD